MKSSTQKIFDELFFRYPELVGQKENVQVAFETLQTAFSQGKKLLVCGNGGSAADSEHIVGELMKCFKKKRAIKPEVLAELKKQGKEGEILCQTLEGTLRAVSLTSHLALGTAFANDREPAVAFAQQLYGLGDKGDVLLAISTSGNSANCVYAAITARALGMKIIALTGKNDGKLSAVADVTVRSTETETFKVQEHHLPVYHALCAMLEEENF